MSFDKRAQEFLDSLSRSIGPAIDALREKQNGDELISFAICTDEDLLSVYAAGCTRASIDNDDDPGARYRPAEWSEESAAMDKCSALLTNLARRAYASGDAGADASARQPAWKRELFGRVVDVLLRQRALGTFSEEQFVFFGPHDCGDEMWEWMSDAVERLNGPEIRRAWADGF